LPPGAVAPRLGPPPASRLTAGHGGLYPGRRPHLDRPLRPPRERGGARAEPDGHGVQAPPHPGGAPGARADSAAAARDRLGSAARHSDPHRGHARTAAADQARRRRQVDRDGSRIRLSLQGKRARSARSVNFGKRLVVGTLLVLTLTMAVLLW